MQRTVLLIKPEQYKKLTFLAKQENVSIAEINRRAIEYYVNAPREDLAALNLMIEALIKSNQEAKCALGEAEDALIKTLRCIKYEKRRK